MLKQLKKKQKKKGFTLIELVIVLAVLAIIALIAIPNFTKVRNDSLKKADARTGEQIEKITLMAIANEDIIVPTKEDKIFKLNLTFDDTTKEIAVEPAAEQTEHGAELKDDYKIMLQEVNAPQVNGKTGYQVHIDSKGSVTVYYEDGTTTLTE